MPKFLPTDFLKTTKPVAVVTGGAGFIGSHLCERLLTKNVKVICIDNWQAGVRENIAHLLEKQDFFLLERDISRGLPKNLIRVDYIFCFAGFDDRQNNNNLALETLEANSTGIKNLLELAKEKKARLLLISNIYIGDRPKDDFEKPFSHNEAQRFAEALVLEYGRKNKVDVRILRLGDVYGPRMTFLPDSPLAQFIKQAIYQKSLEILSRPEKLVFPVFIEDAVAGIEKTMFAGAAQLKTTSVSGSATTLLSLQEVAKKIQGRELPKTELEKGLQKTLDWFLQKQERIPQATSRKPDDFWDKKEAAVDGRKKIWLGPTILLILLFWFFILPFVEIGAGVFALSFGKKAILTQDTKMGLFWVRKATPLFRWAKEGFLTWNMVPGLGKESVRFSKNAQALEGLAVLGEAAARTLIYAKDIGVGFFGKEPFSAKEQSQVLSAELQKIENQLAFLEADLGQNNFRVGFPFLSLWEEEIDLAGLRQTAQALGVISANLSELTGEDGQKKYLLLFENNAELRPGGGFIGSFAIATFEKGRLLGLDVQDVYSADGQLKGHVEPPPAIKEHLGEANWYLRDSNWSPDFPTSATRAAWFIEKELGQVVDGVIAVDLEFTKMVLAETGKVELPDFNETITSGNLYEKAQFAAEGDFFPGSRAKKNFLAGLARALLARFTDEPEKNLLAGARAIFWALGTRHATVWTTNREINNALRQGLWDGGIRNVFCAQTKKACLADYLQAVEANLGVNKANYFLDRAYSLEILVGPQKVSHTLTVSYKNNSQAGVWPGGDYKNYLRLFVPKGANFISATLLNEGTGKREELEIDKEEEAGKAIAGTLLVVPAGESRQLSVAWEFPFGFANKGELLFLWQKQMGTPEDPVWLRISLPGEYRIDAGPAPSLTELSSVGYNTVLDKDLFINLSWQPEN